MQRSNILVVGIEGLRASALGACGNTAYSTPALDQFAAKSLVFDECYADSADLAAIYRALLHSQHPARKVQKVAGEASSENSRSLGSMVAENGYYTSFITDDSGLTGLPGVQAFHECEIVESASNLTPSHA